MQIEVLDNKFGFPLEALFSVGKRVNNEKRNFLFISKLLGKHLEVYPDVCKAAGRLLASLRFPEISSDSLVNYLKHPCKDWTLKTELEQAISVQMRVLVLGFAETATGLGMSVAAAIRESVYYTTTREELCEVPCLFSFEEEHSHATTHRFYDGLGSNFDDFDEILLVDDEITTGKSMLNLIARLSEHSTVKTYSVLTILDWRDEECLEAYEKVMKEKGISIRVYSVLSGRIFSDDRTIYEDTCEILSNQGEKYVYSMEIKQRKKCMTKSGKIRSYYKDSGRFGVRWEDISAMEQDGSEIANYIQLYLLMEMGCKILVLGEGEDIYFPSRVASHLEVYDHEVRFKTTTRSPIYLDGEIIQDKHKYTDGECVTFYLYNKKQMEEEFDFILFLPEIHRNQNLISTATTINL